MDSCPDIFHTNDHNSPQAQLRNGKVEDKDISMQKSDAINNTMPTNELLPESDDADRCMDSHFSPSFVSRLGSSDSNIDVNVDIIHNSGYKFRSDEEENPLNNNYVDHFSRSKIDVNLNISRNSSSEGEDPLLDNDDVNHLHYDMTEVISEGSSALEFVASLEESDLELKGLGGRLSIPYGDEAVFDFGNEAIRNNLVEKRGFTMCGCKDAIEVVNHGDMTYGTHQPLSSSCLQVEVERGHAIWNDCKDAMKTKCIVDAIQSRNATDGSNSIDSVQCKDLATRNHASKIRDDVPPSLVFCLPSKHTSKSTSVPSTISIHKKNEVEDSSIAMYKTSCALNPNFIENEGGTPSMQPRDEESATPSSSIFTSRTLSYDGIFVSNSNPTVFTFSSELSPKISSPRKPDCSKQDKGSRQHEASPPKQKPRRKSNIEIDRDGSTHRFHPLYWIMALSFMIGTVTLLAVFTLNSKDDDNPNLIWLDGDTAVYDIVAESENESNGDEDGSSNLPSSFPSLPLMNSVVYSRMPTTEPNVDSVLTQETAGTTNFPLNKTEPNENDIVVATINATINLASPDHLDTNTAANITAPTNLNQKSNMSLPVLSTPGDNDWNDCLNATLASELFLKHFTSLSTYLSNPQYPIELHFPQPNHPENYVFLHKGVLMIACNLVGGQVDHNWNPRIDGDIDFVLESSKRYQGQYRSVVIFVHSFRNRFLSGVKKWFKHIDVPVIYFHGNGHVWEWLEGRYKDWPNFLSVQVDQGGNAPPILE